MPRNNRIILENELYEIIPRAKESLPLPPNDTSREILQGILGRVQRDNKVTLSNFVDMNSHHHIHVLPTDPPKLSNFYMELQKKITDSLKKMLGKHSLTLWETRPPVTLIATLEDAIERVIYLFCNPAKAGLVDSIDHHPGLNSWAAFKTCPPDVDAEISLNVRWHPVRSLKPLSYLSEQRQLSVEADQLNLQSIQKSRDSIPYELVFKPLAWLKPFGITDPCAIENIRARIIRSVREREEAFRQDRKKRSQPCIGIARLREQPYLKPHSPRKKGNRISVICRDIQRRINLIRLLKGISATCRECYRKARQGLSAQWPPGVFIPWLPPTDFYRIRPAPE